jgi:pilus assembly protein CpaB
VSQIDAQKLALAQQVGSLGLVLANPAAETNPAVQTVSVDDLRDGAYVGDLTRPRTRPMAVRYGPPPPRRARPAAPRPSVSTSTVQIVRGTTDSSYEVGHYAGL